MNKIHDLILVYDESAVKKKMPERNAHNFTSL